MADNVGYTAGAGTTIATDDVGGVQYQRVKNVFGGDGVATDVQASAPLPIFPTHTGRTFVHYWITGAAAAATATDALITLAKISAIGGSTTTGTSFTVTSGKRFRITGMTFATRGNATATAQATVFSIKANAGGATTAASNNVIQVRCATPATASAYDRVQLFFDDMGLEIAGDGLMSFAVNANAVYATNAPTFDIAITGYEY